LAFALVELVKSSPLRLQSASTVHSSAFRSTVFSFANVVSIGLKPDAREETPSGALGLDRFPIRTRVRGKIVEPDYVAGRERRNGPREALAFANPKTRLSNSVARLELGTQIGEPNGGASVRGGDHFVPRLRVR
jgi:hypothetical protein